MEFTYACFVTITKEKQSEERTKDSVKAAISNIKQLWIGNWISSVQ
jgi:hypothetical protein